MQRLFGIPSLDLLAEYFAGVGVKYRKAGITLARSGSFPDDTNDPVLLSKTAILLNSFVDDDGPSPEYSNESQLKPVGNTFRIMASSPLLRGLLITIILDQPYPADAELEIKHTLFFKEHQATQTRRLPNEWNWDLLFNVHQGSDRDHIVHPLFPNMSSLQYDFSSSLNKLRNRLRHKIILPHSTTKGVSRSTSLWMESRYKVTKPRYGTYRTIFRNVKWSNVTSTDVVRYFIRTGVWPKGKAEIEMEQLVAVGIVDVETGFTYIGGDIKRNDRTQLSRARGYLLSKYVDLDKPSGPLIGSRVAYDDAPWVYGNDVGGVDQAYDDGPVDYEHLLQY